MQKLSNLSKMPQMFLFQFTLDFGPKVQIIYYFLPRCFHTYLHCSLGEKAEGALLSLSESALSAPGVL